MSGDPLMRAHWRVTDPAAFVSERAETMKQSKNTTRKYDGTCYIGVVGPDNEIGECRDSIENIHRRGGDVPPLAVRATKGYEARSLHLDNWYYKSHHEWILLLDHDMKFEPDTLERLRSHGVPFASGYYLRRRYQPIASVWFERPKGTDNWPMVPYTADPERGKLHPLGASGWGCILMHRAVLDATLPLLKGEPPILEDDMDIWPYDLGAIMSAIKGLQAIRDEKPSMNILRPALAAHLQVLENEIRPLRVIKSPVGSDIRFPFFAAQAGFTLWGDPDVRPAHMLNYPLSPDDYSRTPPDMIEKQKKYIVAGVKPERDAINKAREALK